MNILFLELDRVLVKDLSNKLNVQLSTKLNTLSASLITKLVEEQDFYIVLTSKYLNDKTEREAFSFASSLGLPIDRFITKLDILGQDVLEVICDYLSKRSDVDSYFILNNVNNIKNYSPYVYSLINTLTQKDIDVINTMIGSLNNRKDIIEEQHSQFFKEVLKKKEVIDSIPMEVDKAKEEVNKLLLLDRDTYASKSGFKILKNEYKVLTAEELTTIYAIHGIYSFDHIKVYRIFPLSVFISTIISCLLYYFTSISLLLLSIIPLFFFIYAFYSEIAEVRHKGL